MPAIKIAARSKLRKRVSSFGNIDVKRDESVLGFSTAAECYNFDMSSGALTTGYGIAARACVPAQSHMYWVYRYYSEETGEGIDQYVSIDGDGHISVFDEDGHTLIVYSGTFEPVSAINYRLNSCDVLIISCANSKMIVWDGRTLNTFSSPSVSSVALHYERLFVTSPDQPTKVFFSDDLDPTNWSVSTDTGGFIELLDERGELTKVISFANYLYIFREHGISRVVAFGDQREFSVTNLFVSSGRIYPRSIVKCGSCVIFLAADGMYMFDGYNCRRILTNLDGLFAGEASAGAFFNGKYYLACRMNFRDGKTVGCESGNYTSNGLLVYDVATGEYAVSRGLDISFLSACTFCGEDMLFARDSAGGGVIVKNGKRFLAPLHKHWQSPRTDFGAPDVVKCVREVYTDSTAAHEITLNCDGKTKTASVCGGVRRVRFSASGGSFSLALDTDAAECTIRPPTLVYTARRR